MLQRTRRLGWICSRCRGQEQRRALTGLAAAPKPSFEEPRHKWTLPATHATSVAEDDKTLRKLFDSNGFWKEFNSGHWKSVSGLLQNKYLTSPQGFQEFSQDALQKCQDIVHKVLRASSKQEYKEVVIDLDRLSDQLCRVIDLVDFLRNVHPSRQIQAAAGQAHAQMFEYMNVLNTTKGLNDQLEAAYEDSDVRHSWSEEELVTAKILLKDFAQSAAVSGTDAQKDRFVELTSEIAVIGNETVESMSPKTMVLQFASSKMKGMDPTMVKRLTRFGTTTIPSHGYASSLALRTVEDPDVRRSIYMANRTASPSSIRNVERLVEARAELAKLTGHQSFAHLTLGDKMARSPEAVNLFLEALAGANKANVGSDLQELLELKKSDAQQGNFPASLNAWDRDYYSHRAKVVQQFSNRSAEHISDYFSIGTVMQGLSRLWHRLYGIRLVPREATPGEVWNDDVRRLDVVDDNEGHIAVVYCDLFERENKSPNPAHFTLRCSREIPPSEVSRTAPGLDPATASLAELSDVVNDGMPLSRQPGSSTIYQLPVIGFICDFPRQSSSSSLPPLLGLRQVTTLFHEMGHCLHSVLGRTALQNVAGTRCATDFAELPSVLMEHFAVSPEVLSLYARHYDTDAPLNASLVGAELEKRRRFTAAAETEAQILLSVLDQRLHSPDVPVPQSKAGARGWSSSDIYHSVWNDPRYSSVAEPKGTAWQGFFGHLFGYGAVYYSYLFDRAIAGKLWSSVFEDGAHALDRERGQRYRDEVLKWGGGRDGWRCVGGVLGDKYAWMAKGEGAKVEEERMKEVGKWGVGQGMDF